MSATGRNSRPRSKKPSSSGPRSRPHPVPSNGEIAKIFANIATLLQARGDSVFKIRAYSRAADAIDNLPFSLSEAASDEKRLRAIPGFGDAIVAKVQELAATGALRYYDDLLAEMPPGILTLIEVPGIGPRTAMRAAEDLGISSREDLAAAIESGQFAKLPRVGEKSAQNILRHVKSRLNQGDRVPIGQALPAAETVVAALRDACSGIKSLACAGSLRRHRETVGDVNLVCTAEDSAAAISAFTCLPGVRDVLNSDGAGAMVVMDSGLRFDLRVVPEEAYAAALLYFTGSKEHGIRLRDRASHIGLSLNEYGLSNKETGETESFKTEAEIYARLGLPYIPPEIREDSGEFDAAERGELPTLIEIGDVRGDLHSHTDWTDGRATMEEMVTAAMARGLEYLAITDHSKSATVANGLDIDRLSRHNDAVRDLSAATPGIQLLTGTEMDILVDGALDYPDDALAELDVVLGSIHSHMSQDRQTMTRRIVRAMENPHLDIIAHLTTRLIGRRAPVDIDLDAVFEAAVRTGTVLEINASTARLDLKDTHIRRARDLGVLFSLGTDSHRPRQFADMRYGAGMARRGWCEPNRVINTLPVKRLLWFLTTPKADRYALMDDYASDA